MKKTLIFLYCLAFHVLTVLAQDPIIATSKVQEVTVYLSGAEARFKESIPLRQGENIILFKGLSPSLVTNSVQVTAGNQASILSVATQPVEMLPESVSKRVRILKDSVLILEDAIVSVTNQIDAYDTEKKTLLKNQRIGGTQNGISLTELAKAADFFRERTLKINKSLTALNKELKQLNKKLALKQNQLNNEVSKLDLNRYDVAVVVSSKVDAPVDFFLKYLVSGASWEASYDIVASEVNQPVTLKYKAQVYNNTNTDWRDVKLFLSTGDISLNATRPYLTAWLLNYTSNANEGYLNAMSQNVMQKNFEGEEESTTEEKAVSELNTSFEIAHCKSRRTAVPD